MADAYIGEIRMFGFGHFAPRDWGFCNGGIVAISQFTSLFAIIADIYGGNGRTNFALPNLQGRVPIHSGTGPGLIPRQLSERGGISVETISIGEMPAHAHAAYTRFTTDTAALTAPSDQTYFAREFPATARPLTSSPPGAGQTGMNSDFLAHAGAGQPHENRQPFLALNFCICMEGIFPSRP